VTDRTSWTAYNNVFKACGISAGLVEKKFPVNTEKIRRKQMEKENLKYFKTDDLQWCRKLNTCSFDFVEVRTSAPDTYIFVACNIDLYEYDKKEILNVITGYGYGSEETLKRQYPNDWTQIEAECLFEQLSEMDLGPCVFGPFRFEDDAEKAAEEYIKIQETGCKKPMIKQMQFC
jgi:hypothetical protein